jgi:hypothetical protein
MTSGPHQQNKLCLALFRLLWLSGSVTVLSWKVNTKQKPEQGSNIPPPPASADAIVPLWIQTSIEPKFFRPKEHRPTYCHSYIQSLVWWHGPLPRREIRYRKYNSGFSYNVSVFLPGDAFRTQERVKGWRDVDLRFAPYLVGCFRWHDRPPFSGIAGLHPQSLRRFAWQPSAQRCISYAGMGKRMKGRQLGLHAIFCWLLSLIGQATFLWYSRITSTKSLSFCMTTFNASLTNLTILLPQSRD